uniref:Chemokine interleukin-8-like domain-containing protein n=1 Tax=Nothobranchius pienaari TaxID=704102 RepID=A0A1A8KZB1_9TELE
MSWSLGFSLVLALVGFSSGLDEKLNSCCQTVSSEEITEPILRFNSQIASPPDGPLLQSADRSLGPTQDQRTQVLTVAALVLVMLQSIDSVDGHYPPRRNRPCCIETTKRNIGSQILGNTYSRQRSRYRCVEAILFNTAKGIICVDPKAIWIPKRIAKMTEG